jgi:penicillin-binding protein 1B
MERGTGRTARRQLTPGVTTAGKTGTSDGLRDSWFAGFNADHLVVTWVGNDQNRPIGLTGGTGALQIWARVVGGLEIGSYNAPPPAGAETVWVDYNTGLTTDPHCPAAISIAMTAPEVPPKAVSCGSTDTKIGSRIRRWFRNRLD